MNKMPFGVLVIGLLLSCCASYIDYPRPSFEKPNMHVIDSYDANGYIEDYVKLHNNSGDSDISFRIYIHEPETKRWVVLGSGFLKEPGDVDTIDSAISDLDRYRYFAVESLNDKDYEMEFYERNNDLHISIVDVF
jgi:hypothetical protein